MNAVDSPKSLSDPLEIQRRKKLLHEPHMLKLTQYVEGLRKANPDCEYPDFDPLDGGCNAEILFLLEKPGPKTSEQGGGSGFISRNNDDETAKATFIFMAEATIPRVKTILWNVIPGWNETIDIRASEHKAGIAECVKNLLPLLPKLKKIVLVGVKAQKIESFISDSELQIFKSFHPSPKNRSLQPEQWNSISVEWKKAYLA